MMLRGLIQLAAALLLAGCTTSTTSVSLLPQEHAWWRYYPERSDNWDYFTQAIVPRPAVPVVSKVEVKRSALPETLLAGVVALVAPVAGVASSMTAVPAGSAPLVAGSAPLVAGSGMMLPPAIVAPPATIGAVSAYPVPVGDPLNERVATLKVDRAPRPAPAQARDKAERNYTITNTGTVTDGGAASQSPAEPPVVAPVEMGGAGSAAQGEPVPVPEAPSGSEPSSMTGYEPSGSEPVSNGAALPPAAAVPAESAAAAPVTALADEQFAAELAAVEDKKSAAATAAAASEVKVPEAVPEPEAVATPQAVAEPEVGSPPSGVEPDPDANPGFSVHAGSYLLQENADLIVSKVKETGLPVYQKAALVEDKQFTRVYVGPFTALSEAQGAMDKLQGVFALAQGGDDLAAGKIVKAAQ